MYINTARLKEIIRNEMDKCSSKREELKRELEKLEDRQIALRQNLEQVSFVEDLAYSFHSVVSKGEDGQNDRHVNPETLARQKDTLVVVPEKNTASSRDLIKRLMEDELRIFSGNRRRS